MKKYFYSLCIALVAATGFTACSDDDDNYQWASAEGQQVYFANGLSSKIELAMSGSEFNVPIRRVKSDDAITVSLAHTDTTGFYNVPTSVSFAAGEKEAVIKIGYDNTKMIYDKFVPDTISIASTDMTSPYGSSVYAFSAGALSPYKDLGMGSYYDGFWEFTSKVSIKQNTENPSVFRIYGAYDPVDDGNQDDYLEIRILKPGDVIGDITVTQSDLVFWAEDFNSGYHHTNYDADVLVIHPYGFSNTHAEEFWLFNRVLEYQENGLPGEIQLAPRYYMNGVGGWNYSQRDGIVDIIFPGFAKKDFSLEVTTLGVMTDWEKNASLALNATLGPDATDVRALVLAADADIDAAIAYLVSEDAEYSAIEEGVNYVPIPEGLNGKLAVLVAVFDEGQLKESTTSNFEYWGGGATPWETIATGDYLYTQFFTDDDDNPQTDPGLELQYNADEDTYRILHWGYDVEFAFKLDKQTNAVVVPQQYVGYTHSSYGDVYVMESDLYAAAIDGWDEGDKNDGPSYYDPETHTFHFMVAYFVSAGYFGHGEETFTLTPAQARALGLDKQKMPVYNTKLVPLKRSYVKLFSGKFFSKELLSF